MEVFKVIRERRAVRKYKTTEVEEEKIMEILEAARWAPYGNMHPWEFIIIKDEDILKKVHKIAPGFFGNAPVAIVICVDKERAFKESGEVGREFFSVADPSFATQNMLLAAYNLGLGSCPIISFSKHALKILLDIKEGVEPVYIVAIGYADESPKPPPRPRLEEIVYLNKYGEKYFK